MHLQKKDSDTVEELTLANSHPTVYTNSRLYTCKSLVPADATVKNLQLSTANPGPCPDTHTGEIGHGWSLARRTEGNTFPYNDNLAGTEVDGTPHNSPKGTAFSAAFAEVAPNYDQFLFATGECTRWVLSDRSSIDQFHLETAGLKTVIIESSSIKQSGHQLNMYGGSDAPSKFPMITDVSYTLGNADSVESNSLYHEDSVTVRVVKIACFLI